MICGVELGLYVVCCIYGFGVCVICEMCGVFPVYVRCYVCCMVWCVCVCCVCGTCEVGTGHVFLCSEEAHVEVEVQQRLRKFLNSRLQFPLSVGQATERILGAGTEPRQVTQEE